MKNKFYLLGLALLPITSFAQNTCASALPISAATYSSAGIDGTGIAATCAGTNIGTNAEWYSYTPTANFSVTITTDLPATVGTDTKVNIYSGPCGSLICVAGDDDSGSSTTSVVTFTATAGVTYIIAFDNAYSSNAFDFQLTETPVVIPEPAPISFVANAFPSISGTYNNAVADMNGDFLDDIVTISNGSVQILYQQISGAFITTTIATQAGTFLPSWSMAIGDYDKNGFNDILYGDGNGVTFMKANSTGTGFTAETNPIYIFSQRSNFVDINNDGHLDAFVCHDVAPNFYYLNDGAGNLTQYQGGLGDHPEGGNYGSIWVDYDNDGDQDLFIAKCRGGASTAKINQLHRNDGNGVFTDVSVSSNMDDAVQTWSSAWNDYDNDGYMDAVIGASSFADGNHKVMRNMGNGVFSDITAGSGWDLNTSTNIEHISYDFDNDGFTDVLGGGNKIMFGNGDLTFNPHVFSMTNGPIGDLNNDGFLDVRNGNTVYMNQGNDNNWMKVNLLGVASNSNGIGARVEIYGAWGKQIRDVRSGDGFRYMNTLNVHFGIGQATAIDSILIKWPSGTIDNILTPTINTAVTVVEGSHPLSLLEINGKKIGIYPNPTSSELTIENFNLLNPSKVSVISHLGNEVIISNPKSSKVNVSALVPGMYFLIITDANGNKYSENFVKH